MDIYEKDNIIEWIFEKAFDQLTIECKEIYLLPFIRTKNKTFNSDYLYQLIGKLTSKPTNIVEQYLTNIYFQKSFIFRKIKKRIHVEILMDDLDRIKCLYAIGYVQTKNH